MRLLDLIVLLIIPLLLVAALVFRKIGKSPPWRAVIIVGGLAMAGIFTYIWVGALNGNLRMQELQFGLSTWNFLFEAGWHARPERDVWDGLLYYWANVAPFLCATCISLSALEFLDMKSGLQIVERVRRAIWS